MKKYLYLIFAVIILNSCVGENSKNSEDSFITSPIEEDHSSIVDPFERWQSYNITNYSIEQGWEPEVYWPNMFTAYIVDSSVIEIDYELSKDEYFGRTEDEIRDFLERNVMTIEGAFFLIEKYKSVADKIEIEYDSRFGYPTEIFIDLHEFVADDEIIRKFRNLNRIIK